METGILQLPPQEREGLLGHEVVVCFWRKPKIRETLPVPSQHWEPCKEFGEKTTSPLSKTTGSKQNFC